MRDDLLRCKTLGKLRTNLGSFIAWSVFLCLTAKVSIITRAGVGIRNISKKAAVSYLKRFFKLSLKL